MYIPTLNSGHYHEGILLPFEALYLQNQQNDEIGFPVVLHPHAFHVPEHYFSEL